MRSDLNVRMTYDDLRPGCERPSAVNEKPFAAALAWSHLALPMNEWPQQAIADGRIPRRVQRLGGGKERVQLACECGFFLKHDISSYFILTAVVSRGKSCGPILPS